MPTGDKKVNIFLNRLLDKTAMREQFLEFLSNKVDESILALTGGSSGTLDSDKIGLSSGANDTFDLDMSLARRVAVGGGQVITLPENGDRISGEHKEVPFENTTGQTYEVGVKYASVKSGITINARSGIPEYPSDLEEIGELGSPSSVVDDPGVKITLDVDNLTQSGIDHSGRTVRVYLTTPVSGVESIAYYDDVIKWVGGSNVIEIPYSGADGPLGQDTSVFPPSTTAGDYVVHVKGASWKRGASTIYGDSDYAFIGRITGNGPAATPSAFDTSLQIALFFVTLDRAYDGIGGGAGRTIFVDSGSVDLRTDTSSGDKQNAQLKLIRWGNTDDMQFMLVTHSDDGAAIPIAVLHKRFGAGSVTADNAVTASGTKTLTFAGGTDLLDDDLRVNERWTLVLVSSGAADEQGLYVIDGSVGIAATAIDVLTLQGAAPATWTAEAKTVSLLHVQFFVGGSDVHPGGNTELDLLDGLSIFLTGSSGDDRPLRIIGHGCSGSAIEVFDNSVRSNGDSLDGARRTLLYTPDQIGVDNEHAWKMLSNLMIDATCGGSERPASHTRDALRLIGGSGGGPGLNPALALAIEDGTAGSQPGPSSFKGGLSHEGMLVRGHGFRDDFHYHPSAWTAYNAGVPPHYICGVQGASSDVKSAAAGGNSGSGCAHLIADTTPGDYARIYGPPALQLNASRGFQWRFRALLRFEGNLPIVAIGLYGSAQPLDAWFEYDSVGLGLNWFLRYYDAAGAPQSVDTGIVAGTGAWFLFQLEEVGEQYWYWSISTKLLSAENVVDIGAGTNFLNVTPAAAIPWPRCYLETVTALDTPELWLDYWEWQDVGNPIMGRLFNESVS